MHTRSLVLMAVVFAFAGCASRSGITRVDPQSTIDLSGYWNDADANQVADVMIEDCIRNGWAEKWSAAHPGSPPVIRLFPTPLEPVSRQYVLPTWWVNTPIDKILFEAIKAYGPEVWVSGTDGEAQVQLPTLALSTIVAADPAKRALADRVRGYLQTNPTFTASLTGAFPAGRVLCGVQLWGSSTAKRAIYAEVVCGNYGAVNGVATEISGMGTPVLLTTAGPPATSAITGFKVPGNDEQSARDVRAWFPPLIADGILFGVGHPDLTEADLLAEAQTLLANGQLPVSTPAP